MVNVLGNDQQDPMGIPPLAERLQGIIAPFFQEMQQSLQNFVETEVRAELERARRQLPTQQQDMAPDQQMYKRRSTSAEPSFPRAIQPSPTTRRSSIRSTPPSPQMVEEVAEPCVLSTQPPTPPGDTHGLSGTLPFPATSNHTAERQRDDLKQDSSNSLRIPFRFDPADPIRIPRMSSPARSAHEGEGEQQGVPICRHWHSKGWCRLGDGCKFAHPDHVRGIGQPPAKHRGRKEANTSSNNSGQAAADAAAPGKSRPRKVPVS